MKRISYVSIPFIRLNYTEIVLISYIVAIYKTTIWFNEFNGLQSTFTCSIPGNKDVSVGLS